MPYAQFNEQEEDNLVPCVPLAQSSMEMEHFGNRRFDLPHAVNATSLERFLGTKLGNVPCECGIEN